MNLVDYDTITRCLHGDCRDKAPVIRPGDTNFTWTAELCEPYKERLDILIEEFERLDREQPGYVSMEYWWGSVCGSTLKSAYTEPITMLEAAMANPCGTAACIAGKAGLLPRFREMGFGWRPEKYDPIQFREDTHIFFGPLLYHYVFCSRWAIEHIHTSRQAVMLLQDFRDDMAMVVTRWYYNSCAAWCPPRAKEIIKLTPDIKHFPVSGFKLCKKLGEEQFGFQPVVYDVS